MKRASGITKGAAMCNKEVVGTISLRSMYEIAKVKKQYDPMMASVELEGIVRSLCGSAKSMGLKLTR